MDLKLKNKNAVLLASSKGIGKAIAEKLAIEGANVLISGRNEVNLKQAASDIKKNTNRKVFYKTCDISSSNSITSLIEYGIEHFNSIDILVNNSGGPPKGSFGDFADEDWIHAHNVTLLSYVRAIREVLPYMTKNGCGRILNTASSSIKQPIEGLILSNVYRTALIGLMKSIQGELAENNILINTLGPGKIRTERLAKSEEKIAKKNKISIKEVQEKTLENIPLGRFGTPQEFADIAVFLCSSVNTYITGQAILVDGGLVKSI